MTITRTAPAPTRATTSVTLTAGLITIPLSVFTSVEDTSVVRKEFLDGNPDIPVGRVPVRKDNDAIVDAAQVTRMAQASDGTWVVLTNDEIVDCVDATSGEIVSFVPIKDAGQYLTDGLYQVRVKSDTKGIAAIQALSLLFAGMRQRKVHALVRFALRGAPRYALLTADGDLFMIVPANGIREAMGLNWVKHTKAEVDMVCMLIDTIGVDAPVVTDDVAPKVQAYIDDKARKGGVAPSAAPAKALPNIVDLSDLIQASIKQAKASKGKAA